MSGERASHDRPPARRIRADRGDTRQRLDRVLVRHLAGLPASRSQVRRWITAGRVRLNGEAALRPAERLAAGDRIDVELPPAPPRRAVAPETFPLEVLYEDAEFLAVDKPPGMAVHPSAARRTGTLLNALLGLRDWGEERPRLVQRLDRDTTGVMLVAASGAGHARLQRVLAAPSAIKEYLALVYGVPPDHHGRIALRLARDPEHRGRMLASKRQGVEAVTRYEVLAVSTGVGVRLSLLACRLETGRMHQIRVHLAAAGLPLVGDPRYGDPRWKGIAEEPVAAACRTFPRQALHAGRLVLTHPVTKERLEITSPLPSDLRELLAAAGLEIETGLGGREFCREVTRWRLSRIRGPRSRRRIGGDAGIRTRE